MSKYQTMTTDELAAYVAEHKVEERLGEALNAAIMAESDDPVKFIGECLLGTAPPLIGAHVDPILLPPPLHTSRTTTDARMR